MRYQQGFLLVIGVGVAAAFFLPTMVTQIPAYVFSIAGLVLAILLWGVFGKFVAKCAVDA